MQTQDEPGRYLLCLTSVTEESDAQQIARQLLQQKLVACVNISSRVKSLYHWQGEIAEDSEFILMMKTSSQKINALRDILPGIHPYEVPEFIVLPIETGAEAYLNWIDHSLNGG